MWVAHVRFPVGLVARPGGGVLYGERLTGEIREVAPDGTQAKTALSAVAVAGAETDQRGLLGLARSQDGRLFASWTRPGDGRVVVGQVHRSGAPRLLWIGPESADRANGGSLALLPDGRLLIGVGDLLEDRSLADDPTVPNRKILTLDPDGASTQIPTVLSVGWNNPYAVTVAADGVPWVADNSGGRAPERIGRADRPAADAVPFPRTKSPIAPAGLVELGRARLGVCGYVSQALTEVVIRQGRPQPTGRVIVEPCSLGAVVRPDGRIVTATLHALHLSRTAVLGR
ncbi:MAG: PQQ-dependent sugar dehydrogenase [Acidimicrobiia bacterium]|nr:PQQ-dependent sugar dehydrogenase [Acidimicrobiia bacterium]